MRLDGKVALVTGAGRGIGCEIARYLAAQGAAVALNDLPETATEIDGHVAAIRSCGGRALAYPADLRDTAAIDSMIAGVAAHFGRFDILVNNAAIDPRCPILEISPEFWDNILTTNLKAAFFCAQAAAREMRKGGSGRIVNISSVHGQACMPNLTAYAASKGGINALTRQMALELAAFGITVNAVAPGRVLVEKSTFDPVSGAAEIPMGRVGTPRDIAAAVAFFACDEAAWITGQVLTVDGGTTTRLSLHGPTPLRL